MLKAQKIQEMQSTVFSYLILIVLTVLVNAHYAIAASQEDAETSAAWQSLAGAVDTSKVSLNILGRATGDKIRVKVGDKFQFQARVGADGYLIVLEKGVTGTVYLLFPAQPRVEKAAVRSGQMVTLPPQSGKAYTNDRAGTEYVKALHYTDKKSASQILARFTQSKESNKPHILTSPGSPFPDTTQTPVNIANLEMQVQPERPPVPAGLPQVHVLPMRDAGGVERETGTKPLHMRLTQGLQEYLWEQQRGRFQLAPATSPSESYSANHLYVEGEVSYISNANEPDQKEDATAPELYYQWTLRLSSADAPNHLQRLGEWTGSAKSIRDLTSNLIRDPRVSAEGLLGELGKRLMTGITTAGNGTPWIERFNTLLKSAATPDSHMLEFVNASGDKITGLAAGTNYQLRVKPPVDGSLFIIGLDEKGQPQRTLMPVMNQDVAIKAGQAVLSPLMTISTETHKNSMIYEYLVLVRRKGRPLPADARALKRVDTTSVATAGAGTTRPAVTIIHEDNIASTISYLTGVMASDPPGLWIVKRIKAPLAPKA